MERVFFSASKIFTVFSIYISLKAGHYHVKKMTHFNTAAVLAGGWTGIDWW